MRDTLSPEIRHAMKRVEELGTLDDPLLLLLDCVLAELIGIRAAIERMDAHPPS